MIFIEIGISMFVNLTEPVLIQKYYRTFRKLARMDVSLVCVKLKLIMGNAIMLMSVVEKFGRVAFLTLGVVENIAKVA
jgi:hypothetical protein